MKKPISIEFLVICIMLKKNYAINWVQKVPCYLAVRVPILGYTAAVYLCVYMCVL